MTDFLFATRLNGSRCMLPLDKVIEIQEYKEGCRIFTSCGDVIVKDKFDDLYKQLHSKENDDEA